MILFAMRYMILDACYDMRVTRYMLDCISANVSGIPSCCRERMGSHLPCVFLFVLIPDEEGPFWKNLYYISWMGVWLEPLGI